MRATTRLAKARKTSNENTIFDKMVLGGLGLVGLSVKEKPNITLKAQKNNATENLEKLKHVRSF